MGSGPTPRPRRRGLSSDSSGCAHAAAIPGACGVSSSLISVRLLDCGLGLLDSTSDALVDVFASESLIARENVLIVRYG